MSLLYKLLPIKYRNANNGLLQIYFWQLFLIPVIAHINSGFPYPRRSLNYFNKALVTVPLILRLSTTICHNLCTSIEPHQVIWLYSISDAGQSLESGVILTLYL